MADEQPLREREKRYLNALKLFMERGVSIPGRREKLAVL